MKLTRLLLLIISANLIVSGSISDKPAKDVPVGENHAGFDSFCTTFFRILKCEDSKPGFEVFKKALNGYFKLKAVNNIRKNVLTIIDFSISSNRSRMWIIDMGKMEVLYNGLVAHGKNSGAQYADQFSNSPSSHKSSLGFYLTGETYYGKNGLSLFLDGLEPGINDNARKRAIVMHGADYVSKDFIDKYGRLGRSFGCPAIALKDHEEILDLLSGGSCLFIYYPDKSYLDSSGMLDDNSVSEGLNLFMSECSCIPDSIPDIRTRSLLYIP